jgi:hypothetical protein
VAPLFSAGHGVFLFVYYGNLRRRRCNKMPPRRGPIKYSIPFPGVVRLDASVP